jgi:hypothetical protein
MSIAGIKIISSPLHARSDGLVATLGARDTGLREPSEKDKTLGKASVNLWLNAKREGAVRKAG